jgi:hypothetical protein
VVVRVIPIRDGTVRRRGRRRSRLLIIQIPGLIAFTASVRFSPFSFSFLYSSTLILISMSSINASNRISSASYEGRTAPLSRNMFFIWSGGVQLSRWRRRLLSCDSHSYSRGIARRRGGRSSRHLIIQIAPSAINLRSTGALLHVFLTFLVLFLFNAQFLVLNRDVGRTR